MYRAHLYTTKAPIFKRFMMYLMRSKLVNSGLPYGETNSEAYCQQINSIMNYTGSAAILPQELTRNDKKRFLSKQALCSVFGKLIQKDHNTSLKIVHTQEQIEAQFCQTKEHDTIKSISVITDDDACLLEVERRKRPIVRTRHFVSGAYILSYARIKAHMYMSKLEQCGMKLYYHDCDSFFSQGQSVKPVHLSILEKYPAS
jgi:hypothetical protein